MAVAAAKPAPELADETPEPVTLTADQRLDRIEAAINQLAFLVSRHAHIPANRFTELDAIRAEQYSELALRSAPVNGVLQQPVDHAADRRIGGVVHG